MTTAILVYGSEVLYVLAVVRALVFVRTCRVRLQLLPVGLALVFLAATRAVHLFSGAGHQDTGVGHAAMEFAAAFFVAVSVFHLPQALRRLLGAGTSEERVRALLDGGDDAVLILDADAGRVLAANTHVAEQLGRDPAALEGMVPTEVGPDMTPEWLEETLGPMRSGRVPWIRTETRFRRADGSTWPVGLHVQWGTLKAEEVLVVTAADLTGRKAAEEAVRESRRRLEDAQRLAQLATWEWDLDNGRIGWSDELFRIFGREPGSFEPNFHDIVEAIHPEDRARVKEVVGRARETGTGFDTEYRVVRPDGELRWVHVMARLEDDGSGGGPRLLGVSQDITRLRAAEQAVARSAVRYQRLFEQAPVSLWEEDVSAVLERLEALRSEGVDDIGAYLDDHPGVVEEFAGLVQVLDVNPATLELHGIENRESLLGPLRVDRNEESEEALRQTIVGLFEGRPHLQVTTREKAPDGTDRTMLVNMNLPVAPEDGGVALISMVDISARLAAAQALREREAELSSALDAARMGIWHWDMRTGVVDWTEEVRAIFGEAAAGFDGTIESYLALIHPEDLSTIEHDIEAAISGGGDYVTEVRLRPEADGRVRWVAGAGRVAFDDEGAPYALDGLVWDVTEQREAERALREMEARLTWVVENAPVVVFALDAEGVFTVSTGQALSRLGLEPGEVVGRSVFDVYAGVPSILDDVRSALGGEEAASVLDLDGVVFEARYHPARDAAGRVTGVIGIATDITGQVRAEAEQTKLAALVEGTQDFVALADPEGVLTYLNPAGRSLIGVSEMEQVEPLHLRTLFADPNLFVSEIAPKLESLGHWRSETGARRVDSGEAVPCYANLHTIRDPQTGESVALAVVLRDLREEQEAALERERMERQLRQAQKMETIGTLAGGIAHDFNNLLTPILGYAHMMQEEVAAGTPIREDLEEIVQAAARAKDLVRQILSFSRQKEQDFRVVDVAPVLREATRLLRATLPSAIEIRVRIEEGCGWVRGDPTQLHQVVLNLATNALHAMRDRNGLLGLELAEVEVDEVFVLAHPDLTPGPHLRLTVSDTGHGMPPEILERVLEPFFTTKDSGEGTGLGLSVVHGIVGAHDGALTIYSEEGVGTTVNIYVPVADRASDAAAHGTEDLRPQGRRRVLVVDDRADIASLVKRMLHSLGHDAEAALGSEEALARFEARSDRFDLMVTDYSMPEMSGLELIRRVREIRPDLPVVLASGFSEALTPERLEEEGIAAFLMKPFVAKELARAVERALAGG